MREAMGELKEFGDSLQVKTNAEGITFTTDGDIGVGSVLLKARSGATPEESLTIAWKAELDMIFGMRYMNLFTRATGLSKTCSFSLTMGEPFRLKYFLEEESHG